MTTNSRSWPDHELSNYRIALGKYQSQWEKRRDKGRKLWEDVLGNALRLAEAVDEIDKKKSTQS